MDSTLEEQPPVRTVTAESRAVRWVIGILSVVVVAAVMIVLYAMPGRGPAPGTPGALATVNALLNGGAACFLLTGYAFIRKRKIKAHRTCMVAAFVLSSLFLITYLLHHAQVGSVPFRHEVDGDAAHGNVKPKRQRPARDLAMLRDAPGPAAINR